jgi:hypothetical protein
MNVLSKLAVMGPSLYDRLNPELIHSFNQQKYPQVGPPDPGPMFGNHSVGDLVSLNPQPLPPGPPDPDGIYNLLRPGALQSLNPQPLPPEPPPSNLWANFAVLTNHAMPVLQWFGMGE